MKYSTEFLFVILTCFITIMTLNGNTQSVVKPYNEDQDIWGDLKKSIESAQNGKKHIIIQFGGNWCPWCLRFHALVNGAPKLDSLMKENYVYLLLNVPREKDKRDYNLFKEFEYPNRFGYPVFVILDKTGKRLNTQDSDSFEHPDPKVKGYDTTKVARFLTMWTPKALDPNTYSIK